MCHGVKVGQTTLISGEGELVVGEGPVRTGVTVIIPRDDIGKHPLYRRISFAQWKR